jgi:penicillin-binding protein 1C
MIHWLNRCKVEVLFIAFISLLFWYSLPSELFKDPLSTVVYDRKGELLGARIANDGQWRFPGIDSMPFKYERSLIRFEDHYFFIHPGVNPASLIRAFFQNIQSRETVSGGSTITMQVIRMSRKNKPRNISQKIIESILAIRLELTTSKKEILKIYSNNAPYGGNVVGLEAASWRYFGISPHNLTWSEAALLAVLPNAPSLMHPGKNRSELKMKRDGLLRQLLEKGELDQNTFELAVEEPLPQNPIPLPNTAAHLTDMIMLDEKRSSFHSTIDSKLQERVSELTQIRQRILKANEIHNMACLVMEIETGNILAYLGNSLNEDDKVHGNDVDVIRAKRSTGSILKPFLFAGMLDNGDILQTSIVPDVPIRYNGYAPKNYDRGYQGAIPSYQALERSLNIPAVILLKRYGVEPFLNLLKQIGFSSFMYSHEHYGLTLILGGAETTLWELAGVYGSMARSLNHYTSTDGNYFPSDYHMPVLEKEADKKGSIELQEEGILSASSIYITLQSLLDVNRPNELSLWYLMSSSKNIAWKTGTSYGFRDAWAVGITPEYLVAVWAGNADGEGRPGLSGSLSAAPLMFDIFSILPETSWFQKPLDDLSEAVICKQSGYIAGPYCGEKDTIQVVPKGLKSKICPYHQIVHLDQTEQFRVSSKCYTVSDMISQSWFVLPPLMEFYYKSNDLSYRLLPPVMDGCLDENVIQLEIVYPEKSSHLVIPRELDGTIGKVVMEVAHRESNSNIFWHLDESYIGNTHNPHQLAVYIFPGKHRLTVVDEKGNSASVTFEVLK